MSYQIIDEKILGNAISSDGIFTQMKLMHIVCDAVGQIPEPLPAWATGSRCDVTADGGAVYMLNNARHWEKVNFFGNAGEDSGTTDYSELTNKPSINGVTLSGNKTASDLNLETDLSNYYTKTQTDSRITEKVAEIVADAPEDFDTLKEISDWISHHEDSAAAMNTAIQQNTTAIAGKVDKVAGKGLSTNDYTTAEKTKLAGIDDYANYIAVDSVITSVRDNPVKGSVIYTALEGKVDKVAGKGLSTNDYTTAEKTKLAGIETGAKVNIQSDWEQSDNTADDFIKNKPTLGSAASRSVVLSLSNAGSGLPTSGTVYGALQNKVDKVTGKGLSTEDYTTTEKTKLSVIEEGATKTIVDTNLSSTSTNPVQNKAVQAPIARLVDAGAKNLLNLRDQNAEVQGISLVVKDGIISASGTATGTPTIVNLKSVLLPPGDYVLSGCPANGSDTTYSLDLRSSTDGKKYTPYDNKVDHGNGVSFTLSEQLYVRPAIRLQNGYVASNLVFKPMFCTAEDYAISPEFVPYTPTMREMYENKSDMSTVGLRLVASNIQRSNTSYTYPMNKNDFDKNEIGTYIISIMTWSTTPKYSLYAISYTENSLSYTSIVKIAGDDMTVTIENGVISVSGLPSSGGKISIHALQ